MLIRFLRTLWTYYDTFHTMSRSLQPSWAGWACEYGMVGPTIPYSVPPSHTYSNEVKAHTGSLVSAPPLFGTALRWRMQSRACALSRLATPDRTAHDG